MANDLTIFIIDDDEAIRDSLDALLSVEGYQTKSFASGEAFLAACTPGCRGCALLDVRLPGIDGLSLQQKLVDTGIHLPVIIMTGYGDVPMAVQAMKAGAVDFIEKPFDDVFLMASVHRALELATQDASSLGIDSKAQQRLAKLTPRERDVLGGMVKGQPNKIIAYKLDISPRTVEIHRARVMEKLAVKSLSEVVRIALAAGLNPDDF